MACGERLACRVLPEVREPPESVEAILQRWQDEQKQLECWGQVHEKGLQVSCRHCGSRFPRASLAIVGESVRPAGRGSAASFAPVRFSNKHCSPLRASSNRLACAPPVRPSLPLAEANAVSKRLLLTI